jgi:hypothetical protein
MKKEKTEEMSQLEKVKSTTVRNQNIMLRKGMAYHHQDRLTEVTQWDFHLVKTITKFQLEVLTVTLVKLLDSTPNLD